MKTGVNSNLKKGLAALLILAAGCTSAREETHYQNGPIKGAKLPREALAIALKGMPERNKDYIGHNGRYNLTIDDIRKDYEDVMKSDFFVDNKKLRDEFDNNIFVIGETNGKDEAQYFKDEAGNETDKTVRDFIKYRPDIKERLEEEIGSSDTKHIMVHEMFHDIWENYFTSGQRDAFTGIIEREYLNRKDKFPEIREVCEEIKKFGKNPAGYGKPVPQYPKDCTTLDKILAELDCEQSKRATEAYAYLGAKIFLSRSWLLPKSDETLKMFYEGIINKQILFSEY